MLRRGRWRVVKRNKALVSAGVVIVTRMIVIGFYSPTVKMYFTALSSAVEVCRRAGTISQNIRRHH